MANKNQFREVQNLFSTLVESATVEIDPECVRLAMDELESAAVLSPLRFQRRQDKQGKRRLFLQRRIGAGDWVDIPIVDVTERVKTRT